MYSNVFFFILIQKIIIITTNSIFSNQLVEINTCQNLLKMVFQPNLLFSPHIEHIMLCSKVLRSLGFLIHNTKEFNNDLCHKQYTPH